MTEQPTPIKSPVENLWQDCLVNWWPAADWSGIIGYAAILKGRRNVACLPGEGRRQLSCQVFPARKIAYRQAGAWQLEGAEDVLDNKNLSTAYRESMWDANDVAHIAQHNRGEQGPESKES